MPAPLPNDFRELIPSPTGSFCDKLAKLLVGFTQKVYAWVSFEFTEAGTFTDDYKALICELGCDGSSDNPTNPNMPAPTGLQATDGKHTDKVEILWNAVTAPDGIDPVTEYRVYRSPSTNEDKDNATLIGTVTAPTTTYDDTTVVQGTTYNYWVTATNGTQTSAYAGPDGGHAAAPTAGGIDAITDLRCTKGFFHTNDGSISLVWTPPSGATHYDIYRNTVDDFETADLVWEDEEPTDPETALAPDLDEPFFYDNDGELVLMDSPPDANTEYYYWVVAKASAPPRISAESNSDSGWVNILKGGDYAQAVVLTRTLTETVLAGYTRARIVLFGGGGGGAGGGNTYGGGGGGGAGVVIEEFTVAEGDVIQLLANPDADDTGNSAKQTNGSDGSDMTIEINSVLKMTAEGGGGGQYSASGGGAGGSAGSGSGTTSPTVYPGKAGKAASAGNGGATGYRFGARRFPGAHFNGFAAGTSHNGDGGIGNAVPGGGSYRNPSAPDEATGGAGASGYAIVALGL